MGSQDAPPSHVPSYVIPVCNLMLQIGGGLWTLCYVLTIRESSRTRSYGMPLFALVNNFAWEFIYGILIVEEMLERLVFTIWLIIDCGMVYCLIKYGKNEWSHSPAIGNNLGKIFMALMLPALVGHYAFASWWIENEIGRKEGKFYNGTMGPDTTELGFWSAAAVQLYLSAASLAQLVTRQHTGGVSWGIWATRTLGSVIGLDVYYIWIWYHWSEAHEYVWSPIGIFIWLLPLILDIAYAFVFSYVRSIERVIPDGRKLRQSSGVLGTKDIRSIKDR